ncbi:hypothetical protein L1049_025690 [Liquidambar formosana]|uniref:Ionotropic glutamate receptor C-terminal domain-containing protein n=1 Tax=Liquidambar formosana TaxID=63359 RepID=A0AAP0NDA4_LIQFO
MMEKGYVWIVSDEIASLLDSVEDSVISNMQGVIGFKTIFVDSSESFKQFKLKFRRKYGSEYPEEEENSKPSVFALRAYDTTWAVGQATAKSLKNPTSKKLLEEFLSSDFEGLSGRISFKNGKLSNVAKIRIINVVGKMYNEIAYWSPEFGLSENNRLLDSGATERSGNGNGSAGELGPVYWPGGLQTVPPGWTRGNEEKPLKIGVPARGAFNQFVRVSHDPEMNRTGVTGFSVDVFEAAVKRLPYYLPYVLVPFYGSYDDMVEQVYQKSLDAAVGDTEIISERYRYAEFSQPYVESGLVMVVPQKPEKYKTPWLALETFKKEMWLIMAAMHMFIGFVIWFIERGDNPDFEGFGAMLWFAVTLIFFIQREQVKTNLARFVLAPWLFVLLIVTTSFTATLTSMMTVSRLQPSVVDIELLKRTNAAVGCNGNSFIVSYLTNVLHFKPENIKKIDSISEYPDSFKRGNIKAGFVFVAWRGVAWCGGLYCLTGSILCLNDHSCRARWGSSLLELPSI